MNKHVNVILSISEYQNTEAENKVTQRIISTDSRGFKGFAGIIATFFDFKEKYDALLEELANSDRYEKMDIFTDLLHNIIDLCDTQYMGIHDDKTIKKIEGLISFGYKCLKLDNFERPNRFVFYTDDNLPEWIKKIIDYSIYQVFESQDGDNVVHNRSAEITMEDERSDCSCDSCSIN